MGSRGDHQMQPFGAGERIVAASRRIRIGPEADCFDPAPGWTGASDERTTTVDALKCSGGRVFGLSGAIVAAIMGGSAAMAGGPTNNDCSDAIVLTGLGTQSFSNVGATTSGPAVACSIGADIWYRYTATFSGQLQIDTCSGTTMDTVIAVYRGCNCGALQFVGCNDQGPGCGDGSLMIIEVTAGTCYHIRVGGFQGTTGTDTLRLIASDPQIAVNANKIITGVAAGDKLGISVSGGGRVNSGSLDDVIVGASLNDAGGTDAGRAYVRAGSSSSSSSMSTLFTFTGGDQGGQFGRAVSTGANADFNKDGRMDLVVGAPYNDEGGNDRGKVFAYSGSNGSQLWSVKGAAAGDRFGWAVTAVGDVNKDGYADVLIGAPLNDAGGKNAGRAYVYSGRNGSKLQTVTGNAKGDQLGHSVCALGDINNDGYADYAVGAPLHDTKGSQSGRVIVYSGKDKKVLQRINGATAGDRFGWSIGAATYTASGVKHTLMLIGAPYNDVGGSNAGRVYLYSRRHTNPTCGTTFCFSSAATGDKPGDFFGWSVAVGNLTGNGVVDLLVGAPKHDANGANSGRIYLFDGATGALARKFDGEAAGDEFGASVAFAGDTNNDGKKDMIIGAPFNDAGGSNAGRAYVFFSGGALTDSDGFSSPTIGIPQDLDGDGIVGAGDLAMLLQAWGPCNFCPADFNGSAKVDEADLAMLLASWTLQGP